MEGFSFLPFLSFFFSFLLLDFLVWCSQRVERKPQEKEVRVLECGDPSSSAWVQGHRITAVLIWRHRVHSVRLKAFINALSQLQAPVESPGFRTDQPGFLQLFWFRDLR